jgi:anaerobic ribonucleoside-triphosphate reductase
VKVLKAVSSPIRLNILNLFFDKGSLSYTELMSALKMNPSRDAGRFAYHLKFLLKADLIEADVEARKYRLTELGNMVVNVAEEIERKSAKRKRILVRTSHFALEDFDANRIVDSLIKEASMPVDLAQKIAKEAEKRLIKSKTKYLTAPLIREVVNAILIEKGLEEYRHKLTRLGLPVHDAASLVETKSKTSQGSASIHEEAGKVVLKEYTLLNTLPRDIADAHLSGSLHINGLSSWILKPSEIMHDLRFFLQNGLNLEKINVFQPSYPPPKSFESALSIIFNVFLHSAKEIAETQTFEYFNVFLAPFIESIKPSKVKETLRSFICSISQHTDASLGLELVTPDFIAEKKAIGPFGKVAGNYGDFREESQLLASLILEIFAEESTRKPLFNPKIIVKIRPETFSDGKAREILLQAHNLASEKSIPYFANLFGKSRKHDVFSASGYRLKADLKKDWEIDTLRTGNIGCVAVNLPQITYECEKDESKFFEILKERLEMAARALEIKYKALMQRGKGLVPFIMQSVNGDQYFRLKCSSRLITFAGLKEAAEAFCRKSIFEDEKPLKFAEEITRYILDFMRKVGKRRRKRLLPAILPSHEASKRLVRLDIERYGIAKVRFSGTREKPFYSTVSRLNLQNKESYLEPLKLEKKLHGLHAGGNLTIVELVEGEHKPDELMSLTRRFVEKYGIEFFTYNRNLTYCTNCKRSWFGLLHKCPSCGATSTLIPLSKL